MSLEDYSKAYKMGKKDYQTRAMQGKQPTLPVLDELLPPRGSYSEVPLGLVQIPADQIVGTKTNARSNAFSGNFMPILKENSEFAQKWARLSTSHVEEGIREPIKAYEYMNLFYVEEGNKRVSVMKFFDVVTIPGTVTRIIPQRTEEKENKIYFEFLDFYEASKINYIWFSEEGSFAKLQEAVGKEPQEAWTHEEQLEFSSIYTRFKAEYQEKIGKKLHITPGDAFLSFIMLHGYEEVCRKSMAELKQLILRSCEEFKLLDNENNIDLKLDPNTGRKSLFGSILPLGSQKFKVGFLYEKTPASSAWTYAHELGRLHLEEAFSDEVTTLYYDNVTADMAEEYIEKCIQNGCNLIFTTTPTFVQASVKQAIANPDIRIVNCSLNISHRYIRTYYARMYEAKYLMGAIAGAMADNNRLMYIADYPIRGTIANINAFALGAKLVNPRAEVYLEWSSAKNEDLASRIRDVHPDCISGKDMVIPEEASRYFGIYHMEDGQPYNLAIPLWHWGKFYEELIRTIMNGKWKEDDSSPKKKAINYWWGMSAGVIDVICSQNLPIGTKRLVDLLKQTISTGEFNPFTGILYSQDGLIQDDPKRILTPEEIINMDWLARSVIGTIPKEEELLEEAKAVVQRQGLENKKG